VGYLLGRKHRFKWAALLGAAAATGRLHAMTAQALQKGTAVMRSTPELAKLADGGGRLWEAGRGAALSAMNSRMDSMEDTLKARTDTLGRIRPGGGESEQGSGGSRWPNWCSPSSSCCAGWWSGRPFAGWRPEA
jgi:hypothetical protein